MHLTLSKQMDVLFGEVVKCAPQILIKTGQEGVTNAMCCRLGSGGADGAEGGDRGGVAAVQRDGHGHGPPAGRVPGPPHHRLGGPQDRPDRAGGAGVARAHCHHQHGGNQSPVLVPIDFCGLPSAQLYIRFYFWRPTQHSCLSDNGIE